MMETCSYERYSFYVSKSDYGEVDQLWVVFCSKEIKKREEKTFDEKIHKDLEAAEKSLKKLSNHEFACEADARIAAKQWLNDNEFYEFTRLEIKNKSRRLNNNKGRPRKDEEVLTSYLELIRKVIMACCESCYSALIQVSFLVMHITIVKVAVGNNTFRIGS
jgi:transposase